MQILTLCLSVFVLKPHQNQYESQGDFLAKICCLTYRTGSVRYSLKTMLKTSNPQNYKTDIQIFRFLYLKVSCISHVMSLASELFFFAGKNPAANSLTSSDDRSESSGLD